MNILFTLSLSIEVDRSINNYSLESEPKNYINLSSENLVF